MRVLAAILRPFYVLLYHQLAWTYDFVASVVSLGHWKEWVLAALPYLQSPSILELGHGPGHLMIALSQNGLRVFGLDESRFMSHMAGLRLKQANVPLRLLRGYAQNLPLGPASFQCVVSTFPSEYIFDPKTLEEVSRVLSPGGRFVVLPWAWITGGALPEKLAAGLARVTGEAPSPVGLPPPGFVKRLQTAGFNVTWETVPLHSSALLVIVATKPAA
jgi:ubiquinone/menaquinone biosynthesis C-methylase UbiE